MTSVGLPELTFLMRGLGWTLALTAMGFLGGIIVGIAIALLRVSDSRVASSAAQGWISILQGTPLLMQLFLIYYGLPLVGITVPAWTAVAIALTAHASAYLGEIWRGAIQAIPRGQFEAGRALGLHYPSIMMDAILPQAFKISMPATVGFLVQLLKGTSLAAILGFIELTRSGQIVSNQTFRPLLVFGLIGLLYFLLCWPISLFGRRLELRLSQGGR